MSVHIEIPLKTIQLSVAKNLVNRFLQELWNQFNEALGRVGCVHYYIPTSDPEIYVYRIHWADRDLHFEAELQFYNHTAKGLKSIAYGAINKESRVADDVVELKISESIKQVLVADLSPNNAPNGYVCIPFSTPFRLAGNYHLRLSDLLLIKVDDEEGCTGHLLAPIHSRNKSDINQEAIDKAVRICAILTTLTQNLFIPNTSLEWEVYTSQQYLDICSRYLPCGIFADDSGFVKYGNTAPNSFQTHEIIETMDCVSDSLLRLPIQSDLIIKRIIEQDDFQQACNRFSEALYLRSLTGSNLLPLQIVSYEIIAYTATIEALLDTEKVSTKIECEKCNNVLFTEDWKISEKYKTFVIKLCTNDDLFKRYFKPLYDDRSKFVHTGKDLYDFNAIRSGRPAILMGKRIATRTPNYYGNIHELTGWLIRKHFYLDTLVNNVDVR